MLDLKQELNSRLLDTLRCPVCGAPMGVDTNGRSLACSGAVSDRNPKGKTHLFDGGAGGYVNLSPNHSGGGDSKEAVRARSSFLRSGYYTPAAEAIAGLISDEELTADYIIPAAFDKRVGGAVAAAVAEAARKTGVARI